MASAQQQERHFPKGRVIFRQGDLGDEMFVISRGRVRLTIGANGQEREIAVLGPGEFFGELSLLSDIPRTATAEAAEDSTLLAIGRDVFAMLVQDDLDVVFRMMHTQGERLSRADRPLQELTQKLGRVRVVAYAVRRACGSHAPTATRINIDGLAEDTRLTLATVEATVSELVRQGIGSLQEHTWCFHDEEQVRGLLDALCRYATPGHESRG